jgi:hypothetical protein
MDTQLSNSQLINADSGNYEYYSGTMRIKMTNKTPRSDKVYALTPPDALGMEALDLARKLELENEKMRQFIDKWRYDGCLQTYQSREAFRQQASELVIGILYE